MVNINDFGDTDLTEQTVNGYLNGDGSISDSFDSPDNAVEEIDFNALVNNMDKLANKQKSPMSELDLAQPTYSANNEEVDIESEIQEFEKELNLDAWAEQVSQSLATETGEKQVSTDVSLDR